MSPNAKILSGPLAAVDLDSPFPGEGTLADYYRRVRTTTERLCAPLKTEDYVVQSMDDVSPTKWHLAHTSWFFETFVLGPGNSKYRPFHPEYAFLFNSYYNTVGAMHDRPKRGLLSRPTVEEIFAYRDYVDEQMTAFLEGRRSPRLEDLAPAVVVGLHHEQQHQELLLTDIKHVLSVNPLAPVYRNLEKGIEKGAPEAKWLEFEEGLVELGFAGAGFCYDNELPRHRTFLEGHRLSNRPVTNAEYLEFIDDGGYARPNLWLSEGWATIQQHGWQAPLYWIKRDETWLQFTLGGLRDIRPSEPVCHVSYFEADAFARWSEARLPSEAEWENAALGLEPKGNFLERDRFHPVPLQAAAAPGRPAQMFGDVWEWTRSAYSPYPGFRPPEGALGEYNGKFMSSQMVLRGGSCATPRSHIRASYRNFFPPHSRWQFMGIRLASDR